MSIKPASTRIQLATSYIIRVKNSAGALVDVGAIQTINPSESRDVTASFEIGTTLGKRIGEPFEMVPGLVREKSLTVKRIRLYRANLMEALGAKVGTQTLFEMDTPFEIHESVSTPQFNQDGTPNISAPATEVVQKIYKDAWISRYDSTRDVSGGDIREIENATIVYGQVETPALQSQGF
jgi:hypothetical protein